MENKVLLYCVLLKELISVFIVGLRCDEQIRLYLTEHAVCPHLCADEGLIKV